MAKPFEGTITVTATARVGEGQLKTRLGAFAIAGSGLNVGRDPGEPDYRRLPSQSPYATRVSRDRNAG
jgi:hypothetical protein